MSTSRFILCYASRSLSWKGPFWFDFAEAEGGNPLHVAASEGHVLTAHILVQAGAELDALDDEQNTPLMLACHYGQGEVVKYLLQAGADMTLKVLNHVVVIASQTWWLAQEIKPVLVSTKYLPS